MTLETYAFRMFLLPGQRAEYQRRHDAIWPELVTLLREAGISDYSIFLDENSQADGYQVLYAVLKRPASHGMDVLPQHPVMKRWWTHMADLMRTHADGSPVAEPLASLFYMP
jgi:L-rhamnose mutarotase